ncbi:hypothetical protein [Cupriavidus sp. DF5525]|uniref:hypothetical protein n=1 Tax=Cupriavidus sp. DF5525 TaxID=3160989 RepID=UPI0032DF22D8
MSDYFGALMQAGGIHVGSGESPARPVTATLAEAGPDDAGPDAAPGADGPVQLVDEPKSTARPAAAAASQPLTEARSIAAGMPGEIPRQRVELPTPPVPASAAGLVPTAPEREASPTALAAAPEAARAGTPPTAQAMIAAALRWISSAEPEESAPARASGAQALRGATQTSAYMEEASANLPEAAPAMPLSVPGDSNAAWLRPEPEWAEPPVAAAAPDTVAVSIGAIHLRVDAPPPVAPASPAAPQQPPAPALRSGLSRRALRRI